MADLPLATDWRRSHTCGELRSSNVGETVTLNGWVHARRDLGGIYFVDMRDRYGFTQIVLGEDIADATKLSAETVIAVRGKVITRSNINAQRPTGEVEIEVSELLILAESATPPIEIDSKDEPAVEIRLRHRYLDLRREKMQRNMLHRSRFVSALRRGFDEAGFLDIETPILTKATPEGARDYLVPSRVHPGSFYALPQSPQIFKQILMVSGFDRYYQVARCFRDEDLRADRQPDFTQLDMEMPFVQEEDVFATWESILGSTFREAMDVELPAQFPRMTWHEAMESYGTDKPDLRFGMPLKDVAEWAATSGFVVFENALKEGGRVMGICVSGGASMSRKEIEKLGEFAADFGAKGVAWWKAAADGGAGPLARFAKEEGRAPALMQALDAQDGDLCLFVAASQEIVRRTLGELRCKLARDLDLIGEGYALLWVTAFPMFELDAESGTWQSLHHPFTAPSDWDLGGASGPEDERLGELESRAYDLVMNGWELGSGSIRIHRQDVQARIFELLGIGAQEQQDKFGFLLEALAHGAPPHGGFALGIDRIVALTLGLDNIRDVIAFPKTTSATDLMCQAPSPVRPEQLGDIHIQLAGRALAPPSED